MLETGIFEKYIEITPDVEAYLKRIGYTGKPEVTLECLNELLLVHQKSVPFENVGITDHKYRVSLNVEDLFRKIILERKGGYCFEMNASFCSLLNAIGFTVRPSACRIMNSDDNLGSVMHRATIVTLDGKNYLCDVGSGSSGIPGAIEIAEGAELFYGKERYHFHQYDECWWELRRTSPFDAKGQLLETPQDNPVMLVGTCRVSPRDFAALSYYCNTSEESHFTQRRCVNLRTETGYVRLIGNTFTVMENDVATVKELPESEVPGVLKEYFGLVY